MDLLGTTFAGIGLLCAPAALVSPPPLANCFSVTLPRACSRCCAAASSSSPFSSACLFSSRRSSRTPPFPCPSRKLLHLHHAHRRYQYFGVFVTFIGLIVVGTSSLLTPGQKCDNLPLSTLPCSALNCVQFHIIQQAGPGAASYCRRSTLWSPSNGSPNFRNRVFRCA